MEGGEGGRRRAGYEVELGAGDEGSEGGGGWLGEVVSGPGWAGGGVGVSALEEWVGRFWEGMLDGLRLVGLDWRLNERNSWRPCFDHLF